MATKWVYISIDGLIAIAQANGMLQYNYAIEKDVCGVVLSVGGFDFAYTYSMDDVRADGAGVSPAWKDHFQHMFRSWSVSKAIRTHFKDAVEAAEKELSR
jgi:hypothetical protein